MRPNLDAESGSKPDELPRDAKLEAGYIRYIRMLPTEGPEGEICFETCIRRSHIDGDSHENRAPENFSYVAISYSWGDPTPLHPVIVDGQRRLVATNLWQFLHRAKQNSIAPREKSPQYVETLKSEPADWARILWKNMTAVLEVSRLLNELLRDAKSQDV
jgi:hypothetical protein